MIEFDKNKVYHEKLYNPSNDPENNNDLSNKDLLKYKKYSMLGNNRLLNLILKSKEINQKFSSEILYNDLIAIECGVANGGSLQIMREYLNPKIKVYGFDSFDKMPSLTDKDDNEQRAIDLGFDKNGDKLIGKVLGNLDYLKYGFETNKISTQNLFTIKGYFNETVSQTIQTHKLHKIVMLRLDADWYEATMFLLDQFYDHVISGGIILIDDFYAYIGCRKAVVEFFNKRGMLLPEIFHTYETGLTTITGGTEVFWYKK